MAVQATTTFKRAKKSLIAESVGQERLPVEVVHPNPLNPRRSYHLVKDDEKLLNMVYSMQEVGQHNPATVYELLPERPGEFMLLRGHRRRAAILIAELPTIDCIIIARPSTLAEELELLGSEEALKEDWGRFTKLKYAQDLANQYGVPVTSTQVLARTGISNQQLRYAENLFQLEPEIIDHCARWEEYSYTTGENKPKGRPPLSEFGLNIKSFTPERASLVFQIFKAFRTHLADTRAVSSMSDLELQITIAVNTRYDTLETLRTACGAVQSIKNAPIIGNQVLINNLLSDGAASKRGKAGENLIANSKNGYELHLVKVSEKIHNLVPSIKSIIRNIDEVGSDLLILNEAKANFALLQLELNRAGDALEKRIRPLRNREQ